MNAHLLYKALWKPQLAGGIEFTPFIIIFIFSVFIGFITTSLILKIIGISFGVMLYGICYQINKKEPYAFKIFFRYAKFQTFYLNIAKYPAKPKVVKNFSKSY